MKRTDSVLTRQFGILNFVCREKEPFNTAEDPDETTNLYFEYPERSTHNKHQVPHSLRSKKP